MPADFAPFIRSPDQIGSGVITSTHLADETIVNADIAAAAGIAHTKLAQTDGALIGYLSRDAAGDQAVTGVGFKPRYIIFLGYGAGGTNQIASIGFDKGATPYSVIFPGESVDLVRSSVESISVRKDASNYLNGHVKTLDSDGFTITWTLNGTMIAYVIYLAVR